MKFVVDRDIPFIRGVLEEFGDVVYLDGRSIARKDLLDADALVVRTRTKCGPALLQDTGVRFIAPATIGFDHIDTAFCGEHNITWANAPGCNSSSVQQYLAAALLHVAVNLKFRLSEKTVGIVGVGHVGTKVAAVCRAFGMRVLLNDPPRERREGGGAFVGLGTILENADIVTLHVPLDRESQDRTFHMVDGEFFSRMKKGAVLINTSRGEVVDEQALRTGLARGTPSLCVLDVWENEPAIDTKLLELAGIGTAHIAGYSADGKANGAAMSVQALSRFFGLGIDSWFPEQVPVPASTSITVECRDLTQQEILHAVVRQTYDILNDDRRLRSCPTAFERLRAEYPLRREFPVYTVRLLNVTDDSAARVRSMGFRTANI